MIKVERTHGPPPGIEKLAAAERKRNSLRTKDKRRFTVYSDSRIKRALLQLFKGKCAYCESRVLATQPVDVEHWRPKSIYWFLAAEWDNLLPSCIDCNRQRLHMVPMADGTEAPLLLGKLDQFPIEGDTPAEDHNSLRDEKPLLLNPCTDEPADFLEFTEKGVIRAQNGDRRAEKSIEVYALNRMGVVQERYERRLLLGKHIHRIRQLAKLLEQLTDPPTRSPNATRCAWVVEELLQHEMTGLRDMCDASQPYALQSRQLVQEFLSSVDGAPEWFS
jgi:hypothetical protein